MVWPKQGQKGVCFACCLWPFGSHSSVSLLCTVDLLHQTRGINERKWRGWDGEGRPGEARWDLEKETELAEKETGRQLVWNRPLSVSKHGCLISAINRVTYSNQPQLANKPTGCYGGRMWPVVQACDKISAQVYLPKGFPSKCLLLIMSIDALGGISKWVCTAEWCSGWCLAYRLGKQVGVQGAQCLLWPWCATQRY